MTIRVRALVRSYRICGGQSESEEGFLRVLGSPLPIFIQPTAPRSSSSIIGAGTIGQSVTDVPSGVNLTQPQETKKK
jgi:hypothetical protein